MGEGDGGVAEHGADAGRLVLLGGLFAGRVRLFAQHRDRRVAVGQLDRRRFAWGDEASRGGCRRGARSGQAEQRDRREPQEQAAWPAHHPGQRTSVRRRRPPVLRRPPRPALRLCRPACDQGDDEGDRHRRGHAVEDGARARAKSWGTVEKSLAAPAPAPAFSATLAQLASPPWLTQSATCVGDLLRHALGAEAGLEVRLVLEDQDASRARRGRGWSRSCAPSG